MSKGLKSEERSNIRGTWKSLIAVHPVLYCPPLVGVSRLSRQIVSRVSSCNVCVFNYVRTYGTVIRD
jgi:hypothetical protein